MIDRGLQSALRESFTNLYDVGRWGTLAWIDTTLRYRRTTLGPWWMTLSTGTLIGSVGLVWGAIFGSEMRVYLPYFATGVIFWSLISVSLTEGCNVFTDAGRLIKSVPTPMITHVHRMMARQMIILAHNALLIAVLWLIFRWPIGWGALLVVPGLIIVLFATTGAILALGILCTRYRDVPQIITSILQLLFLLTPVMWMPESLRGKSVSFLLDYNPFYYLLAIVREPLLGREPDADIWLIACGISIVSFIIGHVFYGRFRHRIAYWL
jgi:ABC-type polysaccharide/polyol phosphate export permease